MQPFEGWEQMELDTYASLPNARTGVPLPPCLSGPSCYTRARKFGHSRRGEFVAKRGRENFHDGLGSSAPAGHRRGGE